MKSSKKWLIVFIITLLGMFSVVLFFNFAVDPFGVFNSGIFSWPSYEITKNPRSAKISYIDENHEKYDSYILGCSSTSSYRVETLNKYFNASFYNMIMYGADMKDVRDEAKYLIDNFEVKNLIVNVYVDNTILFDTLPDRLSYEMPSKLSGKSAFSYYWKYLFMDPRFSYDKIKARYGDEYLPKAFDVFDEESGCYDKRGRDVEHISDLESYYVAYPEFKSYPVSDCTVNSEAINGTLDCIKEIKEMCDKNGINFIVVNAPVYYDYFNDFVLSDLEEFYTALSEITPFYDFSLSTISYDARYFYDTTHFRNCVGDMAIAYIFNDDSVYRPNDFGRYITKENVAQRFEEIADFEPVPKESYSEKIPVLMYHNTVRDGEASGGVNINESLFRSHIKALSENGYNAVTLEMLSDYVNKGTQLPDNPIVITFDDGYLSNYEIAYPILKEYGMAFTIFVVGSGVGHTENYKDTDYPITPRFDFDMANEMIESGLAAIQSHTFDMHQYAPFESEKARENILKFEEESENDYAAFLKDDCNKIREMIELNTNQRVFAMSYPNGICDTLSESIIAECGFTVTFGEPKGMNTVVQGIPQSILEMNRFSVNDEISSQDLLEMISR
ncbi:MAG: polysaccharide deacetylase family protein [Clostridia bacterium]|nr:polysaccharide deacetylase family protein [Clostridia bacterium]